MVDTDTEILDCDIAIVGGGIAGPALAAALADSKYRIIMVERSTKPLDTVRGDQLQPATCEHLERWGVLDMLLARGAERRLGSRWKTAAGQLVLNARVDNLPIPHPYFLYLNHELISAVLLERAAQNPNFTLLRPGKGRVIKDAVSPGEHGLLVEHAGSTVTVNARCIAIADGRASPGRKALGIDAESYHYANPLLILFAPRNQADKRNDLQAFFTTAGMISAVPRSGGQWKIGFPLPRAVLNEWAGASTAELSRRISELVPALEGIQPRVAGVYPVAMVNAARWTDGNCVLLGDACHALHPGRSQGMNVAFSNVASLAETLQAHPWRNGNAAIMALLKDYETRQRPSIDARLANNHARGLEMDNLDTADLAHVQESMRQLADNPEQLQQYCMHAAGYQKHDS